MKLSSSAVAEIDAAIAESVADPHHGLPRAVVMVTSKDELLYSGSAGYAQLPEHGASPAAFESAAKVSEDSVFEARLALFTLPLDLQADASLYAPALKDVKRLTGYNGDEPILVDNDVVITVESLITHTAGNGIPTASGVDASTEAITKIPLMNIPGSTWEYGTNNDWLALCVEGASGQKLESYFQEHIFAPLGMDEISFEILGRNKINMARVPSPATDPFIVEKGVNWPFKRAFGGHGLLGSPKSYLKIVRAVLCGGTVDERQILKPETVKEMFIPRLNAIQQAALKKFTKDGGDPYTRKRDVADYEANAKGSQWGLGGVLSQEDLPSGRKTGSLSWSGMASTFWVVDPVTEIAFVIFTNVVPYGPQQIWDLWEKVEASIYKGLEK
ncbi:hypothetical protein RQP46_006971 [Phenoliferia psychrophenolica]